MGLFNKGEHFVKGSQGNFVARCFYSGYKKLIEMPKLD